MKSSRRNYPFAWVVTSLCIQV